MIESFKVSPKLSFLSLFPIFNKYAHCCTRIAQWELYSGWWSINPNLLWRYNSAASQEYKWNRWKGKNQDFFIDTSSIFKEIHMNKNKNLMGIILGNVDNHYHLEVNRNTLYNFFNIIIQVSSIMLLAMQNSSRIFIFSYVWNLTSPISIEKPMDFFTVNRMNTAWILRYFLIWNNLWKCVT